MRTTRETRVAQRVCMLCVWCVHVQYAVCFWSCIYGVYMSVGVLSAARACARFVAQSTPPRHSWEIAAGYVKTFLALAVSLAEVRAAARMGCASTSTQTHTRHTHAHTQSC